MEEMCERRAR
jgi:hypothetical protein